MFWTKQVKTQQQEIKKSKHENYCVGIEPGTSSQLEVSTVANLKLF